MKRKRLKTIRWKVVRELPSGKRISCLAQGEYSLNYEKGTTVKARPHSIGVMCFDTEKSAKNWMNKGRIEHKIQWPQEGLKGRAKVIKVLPLAKGWRPKSIQDAYSVDCIKRFCEFIRDFGSIQGAIANWWHPLDKPPLGTICYNEVEVIS